MGATTMIEARIRRLEDPRLLRGKGSYVDDISLPGILHAALVRSPYGHARIKRIDPAAVKAAPGVVDAFTLADGWEEPPTIPVLVGVPSLLPCSQYPLARDKVRYVGEPVAVVVAIDRAHADEAAGLAKIEYELLPVIADCDAAQTANAQLLTIPYPATSRPVGPMKSATWRAPSPALTGLSASASGCSATPACRWKRLAYWRRPIR